MKMLFCFLAFLVGVFVQSNTFANSISLFNDSPYTLTAVILSANGAQLGEFVLNPRDAADWSDDYLEFGMESSDASQSPYSVNWFCMGGGAYGTCMNVAPGSIVVAQSCGGTNECTQQSQQQE